MRSNNPILNRNPEFSRQAPAYADPSTWDVGTPGGSGYATPASTDRMTIDSVVQRSAIALGVVMVLAAATWYWIGDITAGIGVANEASLGKMVGAATVGSGAAFVLSLVNSFKRVISPALVLAFSAAEGVALGAISKIFEAQFSGIVLQAVIGTFAAFAGTLAAYRFFDIKVSSKFRRFVIAGMFGMVGIGLLDLVLGLFGVHTGVFGTGGLGLVFAIAGLVLGVFMLILDFDMIENGVRAGIPERESWRAAFALTVSLVWIYTNLLRILAILQND